MQSVIDGGTSLVRLVARDETVLEKYNDFIVTLHGFLSSPEMTSSARVQDAVLALYMILDEHHRAQWETMWADIDAWFIDFKRTTVRVTDGLQTLATDAFFDEEGQPVYKPELVRDLATLVPIIADYVAYLPIPRIEYEHDGYHVILDNLIVKANGILPKYISLTAGLVYDHGHELTGSLDLHVRRIRASGKDVAYSFRKKYGVIAVGDQGLADFETEGVSVTIGLVPYLDPTTGRRKVHVTECACDIERLNIHLHDNRHSILAKMFKGTIESMVKANVERTVIEQLRAIFEGG